MITGASSGMGRDLALAIAKRYKVEPEFWLVARRRQRMEALEKELSAYGLSSRILDLDLREDSSFEIISAMLKKERPRIMMLVNASGFGKLGAFSDMDEKAVSDMVELNCKALTRMCRICMPYMAAGYGHIINFASAASFVPMPKFAVYAATKAYVLSFSRALNEELEGRGITVTAVCPGPVKTEFFDIAEEKESVPLYKKFFMSSSRRVVKKALKDALLSRPVSCYGISVGFLRLASKLLPSDLIFAVMRKLGQL